MSHDTDAGAIAAGAVDELLRDAAFGSHPGCCPLPAATTPENRWWRAVALGGQGRYAAADSELRVLVRAPTGARLVSLAASTRGSHLRQLGRHAAARPLDARALVEATRTSAPAPDAWCDALLGLAADALGGLQTGLARRLLARCEPSLDAAGWRCRLRWHWVSAETALCDGAVAKAGVQAEQGVQLTRKCPSVRHQVKSQLVHAAALGPDGGAELAAELVVQAQAHGLLPLQWASMMLLKALTVPSGTREGELDAMLDSAAELLARRGGVLG
ncbi:MAG: hypothetical protein ACXVGA_02685 [Mycobacteriaceae bacterium]